MLCDKTNNQTAFLSFSAIKKPPAYLVLTVSQQNAPSLYSQKGKFLNILVTLRDQFHSKPTTLLNAYGRAQVSTAPVHTCQLRSDLTNHCLMANVELLPGFQLSTNLELKLEGRVGLKNLPSKKPALISFSSRGQKCCYPLQIFSFSSQFWWETEPVWVSSFSSEVWLIPLVSPVQEWWDPTKKTKCIK